MMNISGIGPVETWMHSAGVCSAWVGYTCRISMKAVDATVNINILEALVLVHIICAAQVLASVDDTQPFESWGTNE